MWTEASVKWLLSQDNRSRKWAMRTPPGWGYGSPPAHRTLHPLSLGALNILGYQFLTFPCWGACSVLPLSLRTIISKDESSFSILLCPRPVAQNLAGQLRGKAADRILRDLRGKALQEAYVRWQRWTESWSLVLDSLMVLFSCFPAYEIGSILP